MPLDIKQRSHELLVKNRRESNGHFYTLPSPDSYPYQWLWDSCFHAIVLSHLNIDDAKREILSLFEAQFSNGMIPHMIYWDKSVKTNFPVVHWGKADTSTITQPPMVAYAVWQIYQTDKDRGFLEVAYQNLKLYYDYFLKDRDPRGNHLAGIINPDESGEDNSPRFDLPLGLPSKQTLKENFQRRLELIEKNKRCDFDAPFCMKNFFWVKDVPLNVILVENLRKLALIADQLGIDEDYQFFNAQALLIEGAMKNMMMEDGLYWSIYRPMHIENQTNNNREQVNDYQKIRVKTWAIFSPLFAGMLSKQEAAKLIKQHLLDPQQFHLKYLVPTVSKDEPSFDVSGFWRGPIWMSTNWFIFVGLLRYGYKELAKQILTSSLELIEKSGFREQYNPLTGQGTGARDFTWGTLVVDMMERLKI